MCEKLPSILNVIMGDDVTKVDKDKRENANSMKVCRDYTFTSYSYCCTGRAGGLKGSTNGKTLQ